MRAGHRKAIVFTILGGVVAWVLLGPERDKSSAPSLSRTSTHAKTETMATPLEPKGGASSALLALPERPALSEPVGALFGAQSWQPPPPKVAAPPPRAPLMPYRFAGRVMHGGKLQVFLSRGDGVIPISEGQTLDGTYRVESIAPNGITLVYLPLGYTEFIPVTAGTRTTSASAPAAAAVTVAPPPTANTSASDGAPRTAIGAIPSKAVIGSTALSPPTLRQSTDTTRAGGQMADGRPARLLWDGPAQVKLGAQFSVALRLTSDQLIHASPMQVRFDPTLLETVAVKPGRFFGQGDGNFNYRVNADGSIFIGASGQGSVPASDAELLVLTFRPIKPAPIAELSIASLTLQGTAGRAIAFDSLTAFKTAILP
ncbi:MAG: hypothetical protein HY527_06790 [Betaproteobacteria bacterium]|nr:hypothetical protein [Betaproteobacteria bacterium]